MSEIDVTLSGNHILLDGSPLCPGHNEQGKFYTQFQYYLENKYPEFLSYLTHNELVIFDEGLTFYKHETCRDRAMKVMAHSRVLAKLSEEVLDQYYTRVIDDHKIKMEKLRKERKQHAGYQLGAREFTLTYSPKWFSDEEARKQMAKAVNKLIKYYKDGDQRIISFRAVGEVGTNGLSHVHCFYKLLGGVKITDKNFKRAYPPWDTKVKQGPTGHKGGHHASVRHDADFIGYIEKQVGDAWLDVSYPSIDPN